MFSRRDFGKIALSAIPLSAAAGAAKINSKIKGVQIGLQSYSFRDRPMAKAIEACKEVGLGEVELWQGHVEPQTPSGPAGREELRKWRLETPLDTFAKVRHQWNDAGIELYAYNLSFNNSFTDAEIDRGFQIAHALGTDVLTTSTTLDVAKRIAPIADKHKIAVGLHGHSNISDPNEFATPESFAAAMKMSKFFKVNLDVGHFTAANYDPVAYIREHHADITNLHLKDRKKHQGDNTPWGQGDTPIKDVLQMLKKERWAIPVDIEYEYRGTGTSPQEVKKCFEYAKQALA